MVWSTEKQNFKTRLTQIELAITLCNSENKRQLAEQYKDTLKKTTKFFENLRVLNELYENDESIEAVLVAANKYFVAFNQKLPKRETQSELQQELYSDGQELDPLPDLYLALADKSKLLVKKMESPESNAILDNLKNKVTMSSFYLGCGLGVAAVGIFTLALATWPIVAVALSFAVVSLVMGALIAVFAARSLYQNMNNASGLQLEEITAFVDSLKPEPPANSLNSESPLVRFSFMSGRQPTIDVNQDAPQYRVG